MASADALGWPRRERNGFAAHAYRARLLGKLRERRRVAG